MLSRPLVAAAALTATLIIVGPARAIDVAMTSAAAVKAPLEAAAALSEAAIGEHLSTTFGTAGSIYDSIAGGAASDGVILPLARQDELVRQGLVVADGREPLGAVRLGVAVKAGAPRPAIATEIDVRTALLAGPLIGLAKPSSGATTGAFFPKLLRDMGMGEALKGHLRFYPDGTAAVEALARGEVALAAGQNSEIKPVAGADLVGPLPDALQLRTVYAAGVSAHAARPDAARAAITFLRSAQVAPAFLAAGFDPPGRGEP